MLVDIKRGLNSFCFYFLHIFVIQKRFYPMMNSCLILITIIKKIQNNKKKNWRKEIILQTTTETMHAPRWMVKCIVIQIEDGKECFFYFFYSFLCLKIRNYNNTMMMMIMIMMHGRRKNITILLSNCLFMITPFVIIIRLLGNRNLLPLFYKFLLFLYLPINLQYMKWKNGST